MLREILKIDIRDKQCYACGATKKKGELTFPANHRYHKFCYDCFDSGAHLKYNITPKLYLVSCAAKLVKMCQRKVLRSRNRKDAICDVCRIERRNLAAKSYVDNSVACT